MLIDRSWRIWAMRHDALMIAQAAEARTAAANGEALRASVGGELLEGSGFARVVDRVALVPVRGLLMRQYSWAFWSYEEIMADVALAQESREVDAIVLDVDSPGGIAAGCADCAAFLRDSGPKPITAFVGGMAVSASYWLASAAGEIVAGSGAMLGSVGAVIEFVDMDPVLEAMGAKIVKVVASDSPNKRLDPDSAEGRAEMQALVDATCAEFVADVSVGRGTTPETVLADYGQGLVFDGNEAIRRGMAERRGALKPMIAELAGRDALTAVPAPAATRGSSMDWKDLTEASLREHRADLVTSISDAAAASARAESDEGREAAVANAVEAAVQAERDRIAAIDEVAVEGYDELTATAKAEGWSAERLALETVKADKASGARHIEARQADDAAAAVTPAAPPPEQTFAEGGGVEAKAKASWAKDAGLRAEFGDRFETYLAFEKAKTEGRVRIHGRNAA